MQAGFSRGNPGTLGTVSLAPFLDRVVAGEDLTSEDAYRSMSVILEDGAAEASLAGFLIALRMKGETATELAGFARAMREHAVFVDAGDDLIDTCGTGGDGAGTFNISTIAAIVMAGAGARVAKHGNRSITSKTGGSAEMMEALGVRFAMTAEEAAHAIREVGIGFLFAPHMHPAMKHAQPVRRELGVRTVFNLLGPLVNPARAQAQLIGAPSVSTARLMAQALAELGTRHAFVVHGVDGLDEISISGATEVYEILGGRIRQMTWTPADFGVTCSGLESIAGGGAERNAEIAVEILGGARGPRREIVLMNAAAGLVAAGAARDLMGGMVAAAESIDSGAAAEKLKKLREKWPRMHADSRG
jgi:anthranilate phosphoribosyltransferase